MATPVELLYTQLLGRQPDAGGLQFWQNYIATQGTPGLDPEEVQAFIAGAQSAGEPVNVQNLSGLFSQINALSNNTVTATDPNAQPATKAEAKDIPARYTDIEVVKAPTADADQAQEPDKYFATDSETGERVELLKASEYPVGNGPSGTEWLARRAGDMITTNGGRFLPFEALDSKGNIIGTWNMQKNELSDFAKTVGTATKIAAIAGTGYALGSSLGLFDGSFIGADSFFTPAAAGSSAAADAAFVAADAAQLAGQGLGTAQIQATLAAAGVDAVTAATAANLATTGASVGTIANALGSGNLFTGTAADAALSGITTGGTGTTFAGSGAAGGGAAAGGAATGGGGTGLTAGAGGQTGLTVGAGGTGLAAATTGGALGSTGLLTGNNAVDLATGAITGANAVAQTAGSSLFSQLFGPGGVGNFLTNLAGTGIDYAKLQALENEAARTGKDIATLASEAGQRAGVPFTPYTVTTGAGSVAFGTGEGRGEPTLTVSASPEYKKLRTDAIKEAETALGAIDPANSAQSLYDRARALSTPTEQRQQEQLLSTLGARGLLGIGRNMPTVGGTTTAVNPYVESLLSAQRTADANLALQSQQYGTQEAMRQQQLAQGLLGMGQNIDIAAERVLNPSLQFGTTLLNAEQRAAQNRLQADLAGLALRVPFEQQGYLARQQGITGVADMTRGLFGLPTTPGNTGSTNIVGNLLNYGFREIFG